MAMALQHSTGFACHLSARIVADENSKRVKFKMDVLFSKIPMYFVHYLLTSVFRIAKDMYEFSRVELLKCYDNLRSKSASSQHPSICLVSRNPAYYHVVGLAYQELKLIYCCDYLTRIRFSC